VVVAMVNGISRLLSALEGSAISPALRALLPRRGKIISIPPVRRETFGRSAWEQWIRWRAYDVHGGTWAVAYKTRLTLECLYCNYPVMEGRRLRYREAATSDEIEHVRARSAAHLSSPLTFKCRSHGRHLRGSASPQAAREPFAAASTR